MRRWEEAEKPALFPKVREIVPPICRDLPPDPNFPISPRFFCEAKKRRPSGHPSMIVVAGGGPDFENLSRELPRIRAWLL